MQLLMERLLLQSQNLFKHSAATVRIPKLIIQLKYCYHQNLEIYLQNQFCSYNLPLFDDDKTMYFNESILHKYLINQNINISVVRSEFKHKEYTYPSYTMLPLNPRLGLDSEHDTK